MRRMSFDRPRAKVRGIKRRLGAIDKWSESFEGYFPSEYSTEPYWNWKIPVLDRMVEPPTATSRIQAHCAKAMLNAAQHISAAKPSQYKNAIVTVLITYPEMFSSEICVFFAPEYYESFFKRDDEYQSLVPIKGKSLSKSLAFPIPSAFSEAGFIFKTKDEWDGDVTTFEGEWWSYGA